MSEQGLKLTRDTQSLPKCPHCKKDIDTVFYRELHGGFWGRRYIYFCPHCRFTLGVSHRKGFFMG
jgi:glutaredoxin